MPSKSAGCEAPFETACVAHMARRMLWATLLLYLPIQVGVGCVSPSAYDRQRDTWKAGRAAWQGKARRKPPPAADPSAPTNLGGWLSKAAATPRKAAATRVGGPSIDVGRWLNRSGVKLLVVEFYATWCKPCMEAVPRWKALHEEHREDGLRFVVVNVRDPEGGCRPLKWNPDSKICDYDGAIAERINRGGKLPAAYVWSWQGEQLVRGGHVQDVERAVQSYLRRAPRALVTARNAAGKRDGSLRALVQSKLSDRGKIEVVMAEKGRKRIRQLQRDSQRLSRAQKTQCDAGQELSANTLLKARLRRIGGKTRLFLSLFSIEKGCLVLGTSVPWQPKKPAGAVSEAVDKLLDGLRLG